MSQNFLINFALCTIAFQTQIFDTSFCLCAIRFRFLRFLLHSKDIVSKWGVCRLKILMWYLENLHDKSIYYWNTICYTMKIHYTYFIYVASSQLRYVCKIHQNMIFVFCALSTPSMYVNTKNFYGLFLPHSRKW